LSSGLWIQHPVDVFTPDFAHYTPLIYDRKKERSMKVLYE
jgi:hypothetical protein